MYKVQITVSNNTGLHTRPGNELVKFVKSLEDVTIEIEKGDKKVRANSLLQIMSLGAKKDDVLNIYIDGDNAEAIGQQFVDFFASLKD